MVDRLSSYSILQLLFYINDDDNLDRRWGDMTPTIDPLVDSIDDTPISGSQEGETYFVPGQSIDIAIVTDHPDKSYEAYPTDPTRLVDGEPIASLNEDEINAIKASNQLPGVEPDVYVVASYHPIIWYIASLKNTDHAEFFRHGMFVLDARLNK